MPSRAALRRPAAALVAVVLAIGGAGCGGSGGDGADGGGKDADAAYVARWNAACQGFTDAQTTLQSKVSAAREAARTSSAAEQKKTNIATMSSFFSASVAALQRVRGIEAPERFRGFQEKVDRALPGTTSIVRRLQGPLARGDQKAIAALVGRLQPTGVFPAIPAELKQAATACSVY
jgi:hypothetical protein